MPRATIRLEGSLLSVGPVALLARGERLALAAALEEAPWGPPDWIPERLASLLSSGDARSALRGLEGGDAALLLAAAYGGVVLVLEGDPPVPLARILPSHGLSISEGCSARGDRGDDWILEAWRRLYWGLSIGEAACTLEPRGYSWSYPGPLPVAPVGYSSTPST